MAEASQIELAYEIEVTPGILIGSPVWKRIRRTGGGPVGAQNAIESGEIRQDRESSSDIQGNNNVSGTINSELSHGSHEDFLRSVLYNDWTSVDTGATTLNAVATGNKYTRVAGSFVTDGFIVGQWVEIAGFATAGNSGWAKVTAVIALEITVAGLTLTDETGGGDEQISSKYMDWGVSPVHLSIRKQFIDISEEIVFLGNVMDSWGVSFTSESVVEQTFGLNGLIEGDPQALTAAASDLSTEDPMASFSGAVLVDDVINNNLTSFSFSLANNNADGFVIGSRDKAQQFAGRKAITGNVGFYFDDLTEYTASKNHTTKNLSVSLSENSKYMGITFPRAYWTLPTPDGNEGPLTLSGDFRAKFDATAQASVIVSMSI